MTANGCRASFWDDENVPKLDNVIVAQPCEYIKKTPKMHILKGNFMASELNLSKAVVF